MIALHGYIVNMVTEEDIENGKRVSIVEDWKYALTDSDYNWFPEADIFLVERARLLDQAQKKLWQAEFWRPNFFKVLNRHSYQKEFYLLGRTPMSQEVDFYLFNVFKKLQGKYELACRRTTVKGFVELDLGLTYVRWHSRKRHLINASEIEVYIDEDQITLALLPYNSMVGKYYLDEYLIVENIIKDLCAELFASPAKELLDFQKYKKRIIEEEKSHTQKTIEIARTSINSLYEKFPEEDKHIYSGYLYSILKINGKSEVILHKDFLENPQLLISKLQKK